MQSNERTSRFPRGCVIASRLCMMISLWQAPIPWFHCHGTNLGQVTCLASALELSTHLTVYHSGFESSQDHDLGWHLHWVLPSWGRVADESADERPLEVEAVAFDQATIAPNASALHDFQTVNFALLSEAPGLRKLVNRESSFQSSRPEVVSEHEIRAVLRC